MENVSIKGMVDGVRINLGEDGAIFDVLGELEEKIQTSKAFFGDGDCKISFGGRRLSGADKERLNELMKKLLPLCRVEFDAEAAKALPQTDWLLAYKERGKETEKPKEAEVKANEEFVSTFRSNRARFYEGTLKSGMTLRSDGHLILLGTVSEGASLIAVGNIIVVGGLYGTAHAGCNGHSGSYIVAMDMHPEGLAIARTGEEYAYGGAEPVTEETEPERKGIFDKLRKKSEPLTDETDGIEPQTFPAVALLKNNKIHLDNFTFEDFTKIDKYDIM